MGNLASNPSLPLTPKATRGRYYNHKNPLIEAAADVVVSAGTQREYTRKWVRNNKKKISSLLFLRPAIFHDFSRF